MQIGHRKRTRTDPRGEGTFNANRKQAIIPSTRNQGIAERKSRSMEKEEIKTTPRRAKATTYSQVKRAAQRSQKKGKKRKKTKNISSRHHPVIPEK